MNLKITIILVLLALAIASNHEDKGTIRLNTLRSRSQNSSNRVINFTKSDYDQFVMKYPRPYDIVIFFDAKNCEYCNKIFLELEYAIQLYREAGAIDNHTYPTFFVRMTFAPDLSAIFKDFQLESAPNLIVSKPHMAVISPSERANYYKDWKWQISQTDGQVTTHKLLQFLNKRTKKDIAYHQTSQTIKYYVLGFIAACFTGVVLYVFLKPLWTHWLVWLILSLAIYITCCSGIVYCQLHDVPMTRTGQTGETVIFSDGSREQLGMQGWIISSAITLVGLLFIMIGVVGQKIKERYSAPLSIVALIIIYFLISHIEQVYGQKGWYGPSMYPPEQYLKGPLNIDQGNNI